MIIGQEKLVKQFNNLPNPFLLVGENGIGKHYLINRLNFLPTIEITEKLTKEEIEDLYFSTEPKSVLIDLNALSKSKRLDIIQNSLLKFIEEPPEALQIIVFAEYKEQVLDTILNRCHCYTFENYTFDELNQISGGKLTGISEELKPLIRTPLEAINYNPERLQEMYNLAELIINKIKLAIIPNTLSIANRINFDDDEEKYNINLFLRVLLERFSYHCIYYDDPKCFEAFKRTQLIQKQIKILNINKQYIIHRYLLDLKEIFSC